MSRQVLIVEDNEGVGRLLEELVSGLGLKVRRTGSGSEALSLLADGLPDAAIVDLTLADLDGFQVAMKLRDMPGGAELPLIVVSGVFKRLPEPFVRRVQPRFLPKPFDPAALRELLGSLLGASLVQAAPVVQAPRPAAPSPRPPPPLAPAEQPAVQPPVQQGVFLTETPAARLLALCEARVEGTLEVQLDQVKRRLFLQGGQVRSAQSNLLAENAGGRQVKTGELSPEAFNAAVAHAKATRLPLPEALVATGAMPASVLAEALRVQTGEVLVGYLGMAKASWRFLPGSVARAPEARRNPVELVLEHARRGLRAPAAREMLSALADGHLARAPLLEKELFLVRAAFPGEAVTPLLNARPLLSELLGRVSESDLVLLAALVQSGLAPLTPLARAMSGPKEDPDAGRLFSPEEEKARRFILSEARRFESLDHYGLLGVSPSASAEECRRAYHQLARRYHSDAYVGLELGSALEVLPKLFQRLNEAMETLTDENRRAEYGIYLERKAKGLPTEVAVILEAEAHFQKGEVLSRAMKWQEALEFFEKALALNSGEPEFHAYAAYAGYRAKTKTAEEARSTLVRVLEESPNLVSAHVALGGLLREAGEEREARKHLRAALELDANNAWAERELRLLNNRPKEKSEGSLLGRLFSR